MSIYSECSKALRELMKDPPEDFGGVFTEIDVVRLAGHAGWSKDNYKEAVRHANNLMGAQYRARKLCRFGPVKLPNGQLDHARIASKIVYASAETGPKVWETPNGKFKRMMMENDPIQRAGRKIGTNRNDLASWDGQNLSMVSTKATPVPVPVDTPADVTPKVETHAEIVVRLRARIQELEDENERLRAAAATHHCDHEVADLDVATAAAVKKIAEDAVLAVVGDLEDRVARIEKKKRVAA